jgi:type II secretion system protein J
MKLEIGQWPVVSGDSPSDLHHDPQHGTRSTEHGTRSTEHMPSSSFVIRPSSLRPRAFTLIELMIAIGIFSMVLAAIYSTWTAILRSSAVGRQAAASIQRARITVRILEDSLSSAQMFLGNRRSNYYAFEAENGDDPRLSFVARLSKSFPRGGKFGDLDVRRLTYSLESGPDNSRQLVLRQYPILMGDEYSDERDHPLVLAKNVKSFEFQFWDSRLNDWTDEWKPVNQIPRLIMVTLTLLDGPTSTSARESVTRIVNIPAMPVQPGWQASVLPGAGQPGAPPGAPGGTPPGTPPGAPPNPQGGGLVNPIPRP